MYELYVGDNWIGAYRDLTDAQEKAIKLFKGCCVAPISKAVIEIRDQKTGWVEMRWRVR